MRVAGTKRIIERVGGIMQDAMLNQQIVSSISEPIGESVIRYDAVELGRETVRFLTETSAGRCFSWDEAALFVMIAGIPDKNGEYSACDIPSVVLAEIARRGTFFHGNCFAENPYMKNIRFDEESSGRFILGHGWYDKYELFIQDLVQSSFSPTVSLPVVGTFDQDFVYPFIAEEGEDGVWMSVTPNEIRTMRGPVANAAGNVLTLGCGMGYFAYLASEKPEVGHVTIVEKEPDVVALFENFILPQFGHRDKITVVLSDAFDFLSRLDDGVYDYIFADIWKGTTDSETYLKTRLACNRFRKTKVDCWIEEQIIRSWQPILFQLFTEGLFDLPVDVPEYSAFAAAFLQRLMADVEITRPEHVDYYMDWRNIRNMICGVRI